MTTAPYSSVAEPAQTTERAYWLEVRIGADTWRPCSDDRMTRDYEEILRLLDQKVEQARASAWQPVTPVAFRVCSQEVTVHCEVTI